MGSEQGRQYRKFEQGELWFDSKQAKLWLTTETQQREFSLVVKDVDSIENGLDVQLREFLQRDNRRMA